MNSSALKSTIRFAIAFLSTALHTSILAAGADELSDLVARVQFAYYAADARTLQREVQQIEKLDVDAALSRLRDYQLAYGEWKLAETLRAKDGSGARRAVDKCVEAADRGLDAVPRRANVPRPDVLHAELHAIQAACFSLLGGTTAMRFGKSLDAARALQPTNPRVLLIGAARAIEQAKSATDRLAAERKIAAAVAAFDAQGASLSGAPDWGQAEALVWLGDVQLQQGNRVAARNAFERALVLAPDYAHARELLARATQ